MWILWVLVLADGQWRAWEHIYASAEACEEVRRVIVHHRDHVLRAECRPEERRQQ